MEIQLEINGNKRHFQIFGACLTPIYPSKIETTHPFCFCLLLFSPTFALIWALRIDVLAFIYILQNWYLTQRRDQRMSVDKFSQMFQNIICDITFWSTESGNATNAGLFLVDLGWYISIHLFVDYFIFYKHCWSLSDTVRKFLFDNIYHDKGEKRTTLH